MNKWLKNSRDSEEVSYWQTVSDIMSALLLILILVIMLLILYVVLVPDDEFISPVEGDTFNEFVDNNVNRSKNETSGESRQNESDGEEGAGGYGHGDDSGSAGVGGIGYGEGDSEKDGEGEGEGDYQYPEFGTGESEGADKSAVYVMVVDAETRHTIKEAGIAFSLYDESGMLTELSTHYPERIAYREYETTEGGAFFLPEKVELGNYTLHEVSEPEGYDATENIGFTIDTNHDWKAPHILEIALNPSRNVISVQNRDSRTGAAVPGGIYDILAAHDIITADGTVRYTTGQLAGRIVCDEEGVGVSEELFLGEYLLMQNTPPQYYASIAEPVEIVVGKKTPGIEVSPQTMICERTRLVLTVKDELYNNITLSGAKFRVTASGSAAQVLETDIDGRLELNELGKNTAYQVRQVSTSDGYRRSDENITFSVTADGHINGEAEAEAEVFNRTLRMSVGVRDILMRNLVSDYNVSLYDPRGELVRVWNSSGVAEICEGLEAGEYTLRLSGGSSLEKVVEILDVRDIQRVECVVWTNGSLAAAAAIIIVLLGSLAVILSARVRRRRRRKTENGE